MLCLPEVLLLLKSAQLSTTTGIVWHTLKLPIPPASDRKTSTKQMPRDRWHVRHLHGEMPVGVWRRHGTPQIPMEERKRKESYVGSILGSTIVLQGLGKPVIPGEVVHLIIMGQPLCPCWAQSLARRSSIPMWPQHEHGGELRLQKLGSLFSSGPK